MQVAIIPTLDTPSLMSYTKYQLVLAQHLIGEEAKQTQYYTWVQSLVKEGHHVILDNGAAEGAQIKGEDLAELACQLGVTEVVAPDVLGDAQRTLNTTGEFVWQWHKDLLAEDIKIVAVVQGQDLAEVINTHDALAELPISTIALPKSLDKIGIPRALILDILYREGIVFQRFDYHLLGQSNWLGEVAYVSRYHPWVRGLDTTYPVALARKNKRYYPQGMRDQSIGSFAEEAGSDYDGETCIRNIGLFLAAANAGLNGGAIAGESWRADRAETP